MAYLHKEQYYWTDTAVTGERLFVAAWIDHKRGVYILSNSDAYPHVGFDLGMSHPANARLLVMLKEANEFAEKRLIDAAPKPISPE